MTPLALKFGGYQPPASIHNQAAARFGELLTAEARRPDHVRADPQRARPRPALGRPPRDGRDRRAVVLLHVDRAVRPGRPRACSSSSCPSSCATRDAVWRALDGELGALFTRGMHEATTPFRVLGLWDNGFRHLTNKVRPIRTPDDCRGLRIRTQASALHGEVFRGARLRADRRRHQALRGRRSGATPSTPTTTR